MTVATETKKLQPNKRGTANDKKIHIFLYIYYYITLYEYLHGGTLF